MTKKLPIDIRNAYDLLQVCLFGKIGLININFSMT